MKAELKTYVDDLKYGGKKAIYQDVHIKQDLLGWQKRGLSWTASGYGAKIPTEWKIMHNRKWKRVYCAIFSNCGTLYVLHGKERIIVEIER
jgi:hypothetical protein